MESWREHWENVVKPRLQREAYREFQECRVKRWVRKGTVSTTRGGSSIRSKVLYSRAELMAADKSEKINSIINKQ